tara:strand:- start:332 stop:730 length:399 start_codon:yes stop_codon:yes gene_type:complete
MDINNIKRWIDDSGTIANIRDSFSKATNQSNVDKFKLGFNEDHRFKSFGVSIYFGGYTGSYGDSSVYNFFKLNDVKIAENALIQYCKDNEKEILNYIAGSYMKTAVSSKEAVKKSLLDDLELIKSLDQGDSK